MSDFSSHELSKQHRAKSIQNKKSAKNKKLQKFIDIRSPRFDADEDQANQHYFHNYHDWKEPSKKDYNLPGKLVSNFDKNKVFTKKDGTHKDCNTVSATTNSWKEMYCPWMMNERSSHRNKTHLTKNVNKPFRPNVDYRRDNCSGAFNKFDKAMDRCEIRHDLNEDRNQKGKKGRGQDELDKKGQLYPSEKVFFNNE